MRILISGLITLVGCLPLLVRPAQSANSVNDPIFETYPDSNLTTFVQLVVDTNPRVRAARAALEASRAFESAAARPLYNPELDADYESAMDDTWEVGIGQTFDQVEADLATLAFVDAQIMRATAAADLAETRQAVRNITVNSTPDQWPSTDLTLPSTPNISDPQKLMLGLPEVQLRQTLDTRESALDLKQTMWRVWFEWLAASGQIDQWLGMETTP